ncbi:hypothetical protein RI129_007884 [Pyrocoelia pectoralis]|uniref:Sushi, von Willebrand factor type A, EGF and pentraxin domain-containing protein 1 n=1 Tax=Pyrocoelia pectoralis TaxID=417401 RepID=A0AAN7VH93_9COLE
MYRVIVLIGAFLICFNKVELNKVKSEKFGSYSTFLNYGDKKLSKLDKNNLENSVIKSKVEVLGEVFKTHIDSIKIWPKLDIVFLIDASSSVGEDNFKSELKFVKKLLSDVVVDFDHSRIAVVTFSSKNSVITNVDEITIPNKENNKCLLLSKELKNIKYIGGGTYTVGAFGVAKDIFQHSRNDTKKLLFLITDGYSNGGDPVPLANDIKKHGVTIFTIGIRNGNYKELYQLSSSPGEYYSYLLDSFEEFESLARRALHVDIRDGDYLSLATSTPCNKLCATGNCCDDNAICTCGTSTGHYTCLCNPGYYGSGLRNSCFSCPRGSFADGPNVCLPCPDIHHITTPPALGIKSCQCKTGYRATKSNSCETIRCPKLSPPEHGYFVRKRDCGNVLNNACGVRCEVGYTLIGSSIRLCQLNGTWSGETPSCQVKTCSALSAPSHGFISCEHSDLGITYSKSDDQLPVDTVCDFSCETGRTLIGSSQRTCLPLAQWDGLKASCKVIKCNKLSNIPFGTVEPKSCTNTKQLFSKKCTYSCQKGFKLIGPTERICTGSHGTWSNKSKQSYCEDITPPALECPSDIVGYTSLDRKFGGATWNTPTVVDNSGLNVTLWLKPAISNIAEFKFKIGRTKLTYFAQDAFRNIAQCSFSVEIKDVQAPTIEDCLDPIPFLSTDNTGANVTWDEPNIFDNSGFVKITQSREFGYFNIGTTPVTYTAYDASGNSNTCTLNITIIESQCAPLPDPIFGRSECTSLETSIQCVVTCQEGYAIPIPSRSDGSGSQFVCDHSDAIWYSKENNAFPDCTITQLPLETFQNGTVTVQTESEDDICNNASALAEIENELHVTLDLNIQNTCVGGVSCNINTNAICENSDESGYEEKNNIIKREIVEKLTKNRRNRRHRIKVKFEITARITEIVNVTSLRQLPKLENIHLPENSTKNIVNVKIDRNEVTCPPGLVHRKYRCVQCPRGTFHNQNQGICQSCPIGFYNDKPGQSSCVSCPVNHSTRKLHSKSIQDCIAHCPPGTHSRRRKLKPNKHHPNITIAHMTLAPHCRSCRIGHYQANHGQLSCRACPNGYTTAAPKSTALEQCIMSTEHICGSSDVCKNGNCVIEDSLYYSCSCYNQYIGSHCETKVTKCSSAPCLNGGICTPVDENDFTCQCKEGFTGQMCEEVEDKCSKHCLNGGKCGKNDDDIEICDCLEGFAGSFCENRWSYCSSGICEHGICLEQLHGYRCLCREGFIGKRCNILPCDYKPCSKDSICINLNVANATKGSYRCECPTNYEGPTCSTLVNHCFSNPCLNNGNCTYNEDGYRCICRKPFYGTNCERQKDSDYILRFPRSSTTDYVKMDGFVQNLTEISTCFWMITRDNFNYGTLLSYATYEYDNTFTLTDYTGLVLYINGHHKITDCYLNDGLWHFICVTWKSIGGSYKIYVDGKLVENGEGLANNTYIQGGGKMVVGQEQDILGGKFSQSESFLGEIAYLDMWGRVLSDIEILDYMNNCEDSSFGDIYSWAEIKDFIHGEVEVLPSTFCKSCEMSNRLVNGHVYILNNKAYYKCSNGFELTTFEYKEGRKCSKASKWMGSTEPKCQKIYCGYPGYLHHGEVIGRSYYYNDTVTFVCEYEYTLVGDTERTCLENGSWSSVQPSCVGVQCKFVAPKHSVFNITTEYSDENLEGLQEFDVGTEIQLKCLDDWEIKGVSGIKCLNNGNWNTSIPECVKKTSTRLPCSLEQLPSPPKNGYTVIESLNSYSNGNTVFVLYRCKQGYQSLGVSTSECILDGYWTEISMSCEPVICQNPPHPPHMHRKSNATNSITFGVTITYECFEGYRLFGKAITRCLANGKWTRVPGKCIKKSCFKPKVKETTSVQGNSYLFEDQVTVICKNKQKYILTCGSSANWEGELGEDC